MKILVPVDGSKQSLKAVEYVAEYLRVHPSSEAIILHVACVGEGFLLTESPITAEQFTKDCLREGRINLEKAKTIFDGKNIPVKEVVLSGNPADVIIGYTKENNIDKIVMGSRGLSNFTGMVLGSVSHKVLAHVNIPVTIIK